MTIGYSIKNILKGFSHNKVRSFLTILGIFIGITSIILIMSLGAGAKNLILGQIQGLGARNVIILPGKEPGGPSDLASLFADSLKQRELDALKNKNNIPNAVKVMPIIFGSENGLYESEIYKFSLFGSGELMSQLFDLNPDKGFFFSDEDVMSKNAVVVIGSKVKTKLFGDKDAVGEKIRIKNTVFKVVGVLPQKGQSSFINFDESAIIPYTTMQQYIVGTKYFNRVVVEADSEKNIEIVAQDIRRTLRDLHDITDPAKDDFYVSTPAEVAAKLGTVFNTLTIFLAAIAAISLVVGGIGIMNIMLVSVTERTREIGLRKAVGATDRDIMIQFLLESVILTIIGGFLGVVLGAALSYISSIIIVK
ncbi:ABC transporter permease, partial [Candidatus Nomurabacteria bacterium]|nr:ABC transporter permease [Candidatus Nomurabacteria bacterium]